MKKSPGDYMYRVLISRPPRVDVVDSQDQAVLLETCMGEDVGWESWRGAAVDESLAGVADAFADGGI